MDLINNKYMKQERANSHKIDEILGQEFKIVNLKRNTIHAKYIRLAYEKGYRIDKDTGKVISPFTSKQFDTKKYGKQKYPTFCVVDNKTKKRFGVNIHKFAGYCYFGEKIFEHQCIRHLNGNVLDNRKSNLLLGTHSENQLDKPKEERVRVAKIGRAFQNIIPSNRKLSDEQVKEIREIFSIQKLSNKKAYNGFITNLTNKYNISKGTLYNIKNNQCYSTVK